MLSYLPTFGTESVHSQRLIWRKANTGVIISWLELPNTTVIWYRRHDSNAGSDWDVLEASTTVKFQVMHHDICQELTMKYFRASEISFIYPAVRGKEIMLSKVGSEDELSSEVTYVRQPIRWGWCVSESVVRTPNKCPMWKKSHKTALKLWVQSL